MKQYLLTRTSEIIIGCWVRVPWARSESVHGLASGADLTNFDLSCARVVNTEWIMLINCPVIQDFPNPDSLRCCATGVCCSIHRCLNTLIPLCPVWQLYYPAPLQTTNLFVVTPPDPVQPICSIPCPCNIARFVVPRCTTASLGRSERTTATRTAFPTSPLLRLEWPSGQTLSGTIGDSPPLQWLRQIRLTYPHR